MSDSSPSPSTPTASFRRAPYLFVVLLVTVIVWAIWPSLRSIVDPGKKNPKRSLASSDVYAGSPYQNARPGVRYVGDAACVRCHREISEAYRLHPMGRSLAPIALTKDAPPVNVATGLPVEEKGVQYTIEHRNGRVFHKANAARC